VLIGRRALVALGIPVLTAHYDFWVHAEDVEILNRAVEPLDLFPSLSPEEARRSGRYVLENDEHVDVLVARAVVTQDGLCVAFDDVWERRRVLQATGGASIGVPCLDDLIATKRFASRARDLDDIHLLEALRREEAGGGR
jgi:hypothetical protein